MNLRGSAGRRPLSATPEARIRARIHLEGSELGASPVPMFRVYPVNPHGNDQRVRSGLEQGAMVRRQHPKNQTVIRDLMNGDSR